jgi:adenine phosphoribosyltransferase
VAVGTRHASRFAPARRCANDPPRNLNQCWVDASGAGEIMKKWEEKIINKNEVAFEIGNIWSEGNHLELICLDMINLLKNIEYNVIAGIETKGIIFASALAVLVKKPLIIFRKIGKLSHVADKYVDNFINWRNEEDGIEIEKNNIRKDSKILIVDDLAYKLSTFNSVNRIINTSGSEIAAFLCFANISKADKIDNKRILSLIDMKREETQQPLQA